MTTIRIPPVLRPAVGGAKQVEASGATLGAVLDDLFARYPGVREQIVTPEGGLSRFVNVFVNDQDVRFLQGLETPVGSGDSVVLLPAMAGGAVADHLMPTLLSGLPAEFNSASLPCRQPRPACPATVRVLPSPCGRGVGGEVY